MFDTPSLWCNILINNRTSVHKLQECFRLSKALPVHILYDIHAKFGHEGPVYSAMNLVTDNIDRLRVFACHSSWLGMVDLIVSLLEYFHAPILEVLELMDTAVSLTTGWGFEEGEGLDEEEHSEHLLYLRARPREPLAGNI